MNLRSELQARILEHPEVEYKKSRFSEVEAFFVGGTREIAHFHDANEIDIRLTKQEIKKRSLHNNADKRIKLRSKTTDWIEFTFNSEADFEAASEWIEVAVAANLKDLRRKK